MNHHSRYVYLSIIDCCVTVDGGWSDWKNVTGCSSEGVITQQRTCTQPSPSCGGRECLGESIAYVSCTCSPGT